MSLKEATGEYLARIKAGDISCINEHMEGEMHQVDGLYHEVTFSKHTISIDEPLTFGGSDKAANPAEIALACLASSISVTLQVYAAFEAIPINDIHIKVSGVLDTRGFFDLDPSIRSGFTNINAEMTIDSPAGDEDVTRLMNQVERSCPILDMMREPTPVTIKLTSKLNEH